MTDIAIYSVREAVSTWLRERIKFKKIDRLCNHLLSSDEVVPASQSWLCLPKLGIVVRNANKQSFLFLELAYQLS